METSNQASGGFGGRHGVPAGIDGLVEAWTRTWNTHDMQSAAALVDAEVDFVTVAGLWLRGRDDFLRHHHDIHQRHMRETTWATLGYTLRPLRDDLAIVHLEWTITGERDDEGRERPPRSGIFTWVLASIEGSWLIVAAHNTNLRADTSHRLSAPRES